MQKELKTGLIRLRVTETEMKLINKTAAKMHRTTGARATVSRVILEAVKQYLTKD